PERFARRHQLRYQALPVEVPALETHLYWHESTDQDPANRWMREQITELCERVVAEEEKALEP
ncbi:MAG: LysR family transcriptional regulator, partial [Pseudomonas alloputida]